MFWDVFVLLGLTGYTGFVQGQVIDLFWWLGLKSTLGSR
jgi:hypothetical protein